MIPLTQAMAVVDACFVAGAERQLAELAAVVTDEGGAVRAVMRSDGQHAFSVDIAIAKARSALGFRRSTIKLAEYFGSHASSTIGITYATDQRFIPIGGGIVLVDDDGRVIGAAAVAGGAPATDDAVVRAAASSVGLAALD